MSTSPPPRSPRRRTPLEVVSHTTWVERSTNRVRRRRFSGRGLARYPAVLVVGGFAVAVLAGMLALMLPGMRVGPRAHWDEALFTSTSAITVTGLNIVDPGSGWTFAGQVVIAVLIQLGGLGISTAGTLLIMIVNRRLGLSTRLVAQAETPWVDLGEVRTVFWFVIRVTLVVELLAAAVLGLRWWSTYGLEPGRAAWYGVFHAVSAFNNAGFGLFPDSMISFNDDPIILAAIAISIILGGLGFPVLYQLKRHWRRPKMWSVHTRLTIWTTLALLALGTVLISWFEWTNPGTLGPKSTLSSLLNGAFGSVTARTAGFNSIDYGAATDETLLSTILLMFIGGGSASTAGGIKVTTFVVLALVVAAEAAGARDVNFGGRRIATRTQRAAVGVATAYFLLLAAGVLAMLILTKEPMRDVLFECVSAIATVGLSTGITPTLPDPALMVLVGLMFAGRLGAVTLASVFALRSAKHSYRYPEGRPIVG